MAQPRKDKKLQAPNPTATGGKVEPNIYLRTYPAYHAYQVKIKRGEIRLNRQFAFDPSNETQQTLALTKARKYRDTENVSILLTGESALKTSLLTLKTVLPDYKKKRAGNKGNAIELSRFDKLEREYPHLLTTPVQKLKREHFKAMTADMEAKGISNATINKYIAIFSGLLKFAMRMDGQEWITNLVEGMTQKVKHKDKRNFDHQVYKDIIANTESILRVAVLIGMATGMRRGEIATLQKHQIVLTGTPHIVLVDTKNNEGRKIPLDEKMVELFKPIVEGLKLKTDYLFKSKDGESHIEPHSISKAFARAKERLILSEEYEYTRDELQGLKFHNTRGRFAIDAVLNGVDILTLATVGGWKTLSVLQRDYYNPSVAELAKRMGIKQAAGA
jgi:integrase